MAGAAYTYPDDNGSVISASSNKIACCVGKGCEWKNPKAGTTRGGSCNCELGADKKRDVGGEGEGVVMRRRRQHGHGVHKVRGLSEVV